jgi:hypothetical protein
MTAIQEFNSRFFVQCDNYDYLPRTEYNRAQAFWTQCSFQIENLNQLPTDQKRYLQIYLADLINEISLRRAFFTDAQLGIIIENNQVRITPSLPLFLSKKPTIILKICIIALFILAFCVGMLMWTPNVAILLIPGLILLYQFMQAPPEIPGSPPAIANNPDQITVTLRSN